MEERYRLLRGSGDLQTAQSHATSGTPCEVPVPRKVIFIERRREHYHIARDCYKNEASEKLNNRWYRQSKVPMRPRGARTIKPGEQMKNRWTTGLVAAALMGAMATSPVVHRFFIC